MAEPLVERARRAKAAVDHMNGGAPVIGAALPTASAAAAGPGDDARPLGVPPPALDVVRALLLLVADRYRRAATRATGLRAFDALLTALRLPTLRADVLRSLTPALRRG